MKTKEVEKGSIKAIAVLIVFLVFVTAIVFFLFNMLRSSEPKLTSDNDGNGTETSFLYCKTKSKDTPNAFFDLSAAESATQTIKVIYNNKKVSNISYNSDILYSSEDVAKNEEAKMNFQYGDYVQKNSRKMEDFSPNFSVSGNKVKISLFATADMLTPIFSKIFLIDMTNTALSSYTPKVLSTAYNNMGFDCEIRE